MSNIKHPPLRVLGTLLFWVSKFMLNVDIRELECGEEFAGVMKKEVS
jgi:hypothetical protein